MDHGITWTYDPEKQKSGCSYSKKDTEPTMLPLEYFFKFFQNSWLLMEYWTKIVNFGRFLESLSNLNSLTALVFTLIKPLFILLIRFVDFPKYFFIELSEVS